MNITGMRYVIGGVVFAAFFYGGLQIPSEYYRYILSTPPLPQVEGELFIGEPLSHTIDDYFSDNVFLYNTTMEIIESMTPEDQVGQLLMPAWEKGTTLDEMIALAHKYHVGGVMVLRNDATQGEVQVLKGALWYSAPQTTLTPLVSIDAEPSLLRYRIPSAEYTTTTASLNTEAKAYQSAERISQIISNYGYNLDFAPVYDSGINTSVIGDRAFSTSQSEIISRAGIFARGLGDNNIIATAKHFPGHGYALGDTHRTLEAVPGSLPERGSFESAIASKVPMIMVGHLVVDGEEYDSRGLPATLSRIVMTDLLRTDMKFAGVVITDAMTMGALSTFDDVDISALEAGADIILMPQDIDRVFNAIIARMSTDDEYRLMIQEKVYRIVRLKLVTMWAGSR